MGIRDTRMLVRAVEQRYNIPKEYYEALPKLFMQIALDPSRSARERTSALKGIIACDRLNLEQEKIQQAEEHHSERMQGEQLDRIANAAQRLGLARVVDAIAQDRSRSDSSGDVAESRTANHLEG